MAVCTICSSNYLHCAVTLMKSVRGCHPEWPRILLLTDAPSPVVQHSDVFSEVVSSDDIGLPEPAKFKFRYDILEFNTACKPWLLSWLLENREIGRILYLDPDIKVYSPLIEVEDLSRRFNILITPHLTRPVDDRRHPGEVDILRAGAWNLGFLALRKGRTVGAFLRWWQSKLEFNCVHDVANGLFVDQKWVDLVPGLFPGVRPLRHEGYNVAYWNLAQRRVARSRGKYTVNGKPLRFAHFSGFDAGRPDAVSIHQDRFTFRDLDAHARDLYLEYRSDLQKNGYEEFRHLPYAFDRFDNGWTIPRIARRFYRSSEAYQRAAGSNPFASGADYLNEPWHEAASTGPLSTRLMGFLWETDMSLQRDFPDPHGANRREFCDYFLTSVGRNHGLADHYTAPVRTSLAGEGAPGRSRRNGGLASPADLGLNIVGYIRHEAGTGQSARQCCAAAATQRSLAWSVVNYDIGCCGRAEDHSFSHLVGEDNPHRVNLFHINADQMTIAREYLGRPFFEGRYNIGYWHWELPEFPDAWADSFRSLDEIWVPSRFVQDAIERKSPVPVTRIPHGVEFKINGHAGTVARYVLPRQFVFLSMYDCHSYQLRKNPHAVVEAFTRAFPRRNDVALVIKRMNAESPHIESAALDDIGGSDARIQVIDATLTREQVYALENLCSCFVSLHRAEGFGLGLAECMFLGKPAIATGWSGNTEFMSSNNSCTVDYELVPLREDHGPYERGQVWADPDIDHAAWYMKKVVADEVYADRMGRAGQATIRKDFSLRETGRRYVNRLRDISRHL